ncbi:MAG TPA: hypothetical protein VEQ84_17085 [Vicinamibacteria bacterium]|nr:hypothetical protein [Vicinamibacteria bacterium]
MAEKPEGRQTLFAQAPVIVSELKLDFTEMFRLNDSIVKAILGSDVDVMTKAGMLERILPGLPRASACSCSCSCSCSCGGDGSVQRFATSAAGRVV